MKKIFFLLVAMALVVGPLAAQTKNETIDKLVNIGVANGEVSVSDVEMLFPELVSTTYVLESKDAKRAAQTKEAKVVNYEKLLMIVVNAVKSQNAMTVSDESSLLSSVKRGDIEFREETATVTKTEFEKGVSPKSAPRMITKIESVSRIQTDLATLEARFPELVKSNYAMESRAKRSPRMIESKSLNVAKAATTLLQELKAEAKRNSVAGL